MSYVYMRMREIACCCEWAMQSSLLRFLQRRESKEVSTKKRPASDDHGDSGSKRKKQKTTTGNGGSKAKLNKFNRAVVAAKPSGSGDSVHVTTNTTFSSEISAQESNKTHSMRQGSLPEASPSTSVAVKEKSGPSLSSSKEEPKTRRKSRSSNPSSSDTISKQYTPLEQQYLAIKAQYPDAVLFVECGYKYRFFGEDAEVASKTLNIGCFEDHNFYTASIPVHRLHIHLRRLVAAGYKVGVVKQTETAALKAASDKKAGPFSRELTALYTRTTLLGPDVKPPSGRGRDAGRERGEGGERGVCVEVEEEEEGLWMMCVCELTPAAMNSGKTDITVGFIAVQPAVGNMLYDQFSDSVSSLSELQLRLSHLQPAEILYPRGCSAVLEDALLHWKRYGGQCRVRTEKLTDGWFDCDAASSTVSEFYSEDTLDTQTQSPNTASTPSSNCSDMYKQPYSNESTVALKRVASLPECPMSCLSALIHHLRVFKLQRVLKLTCNLESFSTGSHCMRLNDKALENLEIFHNMEDKKEKNSLFWILNHTRTPFGRRLLRRWTAYPLRRVSEIEQRQTAVRELSSSESLCIPLIKKLVTKLPDLEKMLCSAYHKKCSPLDLCVLLHHLKDICGQVKSFSETVLTGLHSELLHHIVKEIPRLLEGCNRFLLAINESSAKEGRYEDLFTDVESYPSVATEKKCIAEVQQRLNEHKKRFRKTLAYPNADYCTVSGVQYLVEVKNKDINKVPSDWTRISGTKQVTRFHPPYVAENVQLLAQHSEQLVVNAKQAWNEFLSDFSVSYGACKKATDFLATLDCLLSLAEVALMSGYMCPTVVEEAVVEIEGGRHPVIDLLLAEGEQYVANNTSMSNSKMRAMVITGPNMGGKSSYIKQVALICIMAQIGSFVPAKSATLGMLDAVYTRMGASDHLYAGKSTFMVELMEASEIMRQATCHSLVILDELGRGTSTHDGVAVAYATLTHFIEEVKALTLFVTHYPILAQLETVYPGTVANFHMSYVEAETTNEGYEKIVFLYQLERGQAGKSYGLNVAALAGLSSGILKVASEKSKELEAQCSRRRRMAGSHQIRREKAARSIVSLVQRQDGHFDSETVIRIAQLQNL